MDLAPIACPTANSTFVVDKKIIRNIEKSVSPGMFSPEIGTRTKETNANKTYDMMKGFSAKNSTKKLEKIIDLSEESPIKVKNSNSTQPQALIKFNSKKKRYIFFIFLMLITIFLILCVHIFVVLNLK